MLSIISSTSSGSRAHDKTQLSDRILDVPWHDSFPVELSKRPIRLRQHALARHTGASARPFSLASIAGPMLNQHPRLIARSRSRTLPENQCKTGVPACGNFSKAVQHCAACAAAVKRHDPSAGFATPRQNVFKYRQPDLPVLRNSGPHQGLFRRCRGVSAESHRKASVHSAAREPAADANRAPFGSV